MYQHIVTITFSNASFHEVPLYMILEFLHFALNKKNLQMYVYQFIHSSIKVNLPCMGRL